MSTKRVVILMATVVASLGAVVPAGAGAAPADGAPLSLTLARARSDPAEMETLIGRAILSREAQEIGTIEAVILDRDGILSRVVVHIDGHPGQVGHAVAVGWNRIQAPYGSKSIQAYLSRQEAKALPAFIYADAGQRGSVFSVPGKLAGSPPR